MLPPIPAGWSELLEDETKKASYRALDAFLDQEVAAGKNILPAVDDLFAALRLTPYDKVKVVLLGQDPYPTPGHAHGLCFSARPHVRPLPRSLNNVYKELRDDVGCRIPNNGFLQPWARQGVLMLNTILTVPAGDAGKHAKRGWEQFTNRIIELVSEKPAGVAFLLWGKPAQAKADLVRQPPHKVFAAPHPSPLNGTAFLGCRCFSKTNEFLMQTGQAPIDWQIPDV
jgi:uracil-DNA glycosylase